MEPPIDPRNVAELLLEASPDGLVLVGSDGTIRLANRRAGELFGRPADLVGASVDELVPGEDRSGHARLRDRYAEHPTSRPMGTDLRLFAERADGSLFPVEISLSPDAVDGEPCTIAAIRDVSERQETMARVALLKDRERIARDIHDMVIQRIFAAGMQLQGVVALVDSSVARDRLSAVTDDLDETIRQLRQSIFQLGNDDGERTLSSQIAAVAEERSRHLGFTPELTVRGRLDDLPDYIGDQHIATLTEALSNVARHADATAATIDVVRTTTAVSLTVSDDGVGLDGVPKARGGLSNMMWRAAELGGSCSVAPGTEKGTLLSWHVPVTATGS